MFILRRISSNNLQANTCLGLEYVLVLKEENNEEFKERTKLWDEDDLKDVYGIIAFEDGSLIMPLYLKSAYYVMTSDGKTFANVSKR